MVFNLTTFLLNAPLFSHPRVTGFRTVTLGKLRNSILGQQHGLALFWSFKEAPKDELHVEDLCPDVILKEGDKLKDCKLLAEKPKA